LVIINGGVGLAGRCWLHGDCTNQLPENLTHKRTFMVIVHR